VPHLDGHGSSLPVPTGTVPGTVTVPTASRYCTRYCSLARHCESGAEDMSSPSFTAPTQLARAIPHTRAEQTVNLQEDCIN
jgi:hypothetical protein